MRLAASLLLLGLGVAVSGCADFYYDILGEGGWPHDQYGLYDDLGGSAGVHAVVDGLVDTAAADPRLGSAFAKADLPHLKATLAQQICTVSGGPCVYGGLGMADAHAGLVIDGAAFDAFLDDLKKSLAANHIDDRDQQRLIDRLRPMRAKIVTVSN